MSVSLLGHNTQNNRIVLGLLESVERDSAQSQRRLAAELGVAVGLINVYLKRCVKKGLGLFEGIADRERVAVLLDLMGPKVRLVMGEEMLAAV